MSNFYKGRRQYHVFDPLDENPFSISRSKIDLFVECPLCFYLDLRLGVARPPGFPFTLNSAVDLLLKREFDVCRKAGKSHPLIEKQGVDARPADHASLDDWRKTRVGVRHLHQPTNLMVYGAIDDLWVNSAGEYIVVDYKATAKEKAVTELSADWQITYKRQMEIYQWLLRRNELTVSNTGYFLYCTGQTTRDSFEGRLLFDMVLIPYTGNDGWLNDTLPKVKACLVAPEPPAAGQDCDFCTYRQALRDAAATRKAARTTSKG